MSLIWLVKNIFSCNVRNAHDACTANVIFWTDLKLQSATTISTEVAVAHQLVLNLLLLM